MALKSDRSTSTAPSGLIMVDLSIAADFNEIDFF